MRVKSSFSSVLNFCKTLLLVCVHMNFGLTAAAKRANLPIRANLQKTADRTNFLVVKL